MNTERLLKTPELFTVNTGEEQRVQKTIEIFFRDVLDYLDYNFQARQSFTGIETRILERKDNRGRPLPTDDRLTFLLVQDFVTASVLERRDEQNYVQVLSACYLTPAIVEELKQDKRLLRRFPGGT